MLLTISHMTMKAPLLVPGFYTPINFGPLGKTPSIFHMCEEFL